MRERENKVLFQINSVANSGSTGRIAEDIGKIAISKDWDSYVAYGRWCQPSNSHLIKIGSKISVLCHVFLTRFFDKHGLGSKLATKKLIAQIKEIKPDIIHLHNIHGYYLNYPILFDYLSKSHIPVVWTFHDCWAFTGHCAHFVTFDCNKWKTQCEHCQYHLSYPRSVFLDNSKNNFIIKKNSFTTNSNIHIISVSQWLDNFVYKSFLSKINRCVIYNGIDIHIFKPHNIKNRDNRFIILGVTNIWSKSKGLDDFVSLSSKLDAEKYQIRLVGLTNEQIKKLPSSICGTLRTTSLDKLAEFYSAADVFLNMTYADSFPTTNLEALACGTPVITYKTGGSPEAVTKETGFVVEQGDLVEVVKAIKAIETVGKANYSATCRKRAEENFDKDKQYEKYFELYEKLLKDKQ